MFALRRAWQDRKKKDRNNHLISAGARRLEEMLVTPLRLPKSTPLIVVPTGILHRLPWGCLPSLLARDVTVAPSAALWAQRPAGVAVAPGAPLKPVMLVAGPGLPGAEIEVRRLAVLYPDARVLTGPNATTTKVLDGLKRSQLVHLAAHGNFRRG